MTVGEIEKSNEHMEKLYRKIVEDTQAIAEKQNLFSLPSAPGYDISTSDYTSGGVTLNDKEYVIGDKDENIVITSECKDKCKTYQVRPNMNIVTVTWNKNNKVLETFTESWEDKM